MLSRIFYSSTDSQPHSIGWQQGSEQATWYKKEQTNQGEDSPQ